jgi:hypothetical protein
MRMVRDENDDTIKIMPRPHDISNGIVQNIYEINSPPEIFDEAN